VDCSIRCQLKISQIFNVYGSKLEVGADDDDVTNMMVSDIIALMASRSNLARRLTVITTQSQGEAQMKQQHRNVRTLPTYGDTPRRMFQRGTFQRRWAISCTFAS